jgi:2-methylcitrate dehydratase PrpD
VCEPVAEKIAPASDSHGRVSLQYSLAEALYHGRLGVDGYSAASLRNPDILALARKITYRIDPDAPGRDEYKGWVIVHLKDGRILEHIEPHNRGSAQNPMSADDVRAKFRENAARMLPPGPIGAIVQRVSTLEQAQSVHTLLELCVAHS